MNIRPVLQSPAHCLDTPELKFSAVETDLWGLPRVRSGGFALTYKLSNRVQHLAVRCFHRLCQTAPSAILPSAPF